MDREDAGWIVLNMYFHERRAKDQVEKLHELGKHDLAYELEEKSDLFDSIAEEEVEEAINDLVERRLKNA